MFLLNYKIKICHFIALRAMCTPYRKFKIANFKFVVDQLIGFSFSYFILLKVSSSKNLRLYFLLTSVLNNLNQILAHKKTFRKLQTCFFFFDEMKLYNLLIDSLLPGPTHQSFHFLGSFCDSTDVACVENF